MPENVEEIKLNVGGNAVEKLSGVEDAVNKVYKAFAALGGGGNSLSGMVTGLAGVAGGFGLVGEGAKKAVEMTVEWIKSIGEAVAKVEDYTTHIASLYVGTTDYATATMTARNAINDLREVSVRTGVPLESLVNTFRSLGVFVGGSKDQLVGLSEKLAIVAQATGTSVETITRLLQIAERTGTFAGGHGSGAAVGNALRAFGIDPSELQSAARAGNAGNYLNDNLKITAELSEDVATSWSTMTSAWKTLMDGIKAGAKDSLEPAKGIMQDMLTAASLFGKFDTMEAVAGGLLARAGMASAPDIGRKGFDITGITHVLGKAPKAPGADAEGQDPRQMATEGQVDSITLALQKMRNAIASSGLEGLSKDLQDAQNKYNETAASIAKERKQFRDDDPIQAELSDKKKLAREQELRDISLAYDKQTLAAYKRDSDVAKSQEDTAALYAVGLDKEVLTAQNKYAEMERASNETILKAQHDQATAGDVAVAEYAKQTQAALQMYETIRQAAQKHANEVKALSAGFDAATMEANGDAIGAALAKEEQAFDETLTKLVELGDATDELFNKATAAHEASVAKIRRDNGLTTAAMTGDWTDYFAFLDNQLQHGQITWQEYHKTLGDSEYRLANTMDQGVQAGLNRILGSVKTTGQSIADYMQGVWDAIGNGLNSILTDAVHGNFSNLGNDLKKIFDDILGSWTKMLTEMVQKWLVAQFTMKETAQNVNATGMVGANGTDAGAGSGAGAGVSGGASAAGGLGYLAALYGFATSGSFGRNTGDPGYGLGNQDFGGNGGGAAASAAVTIAAMATATAIAASAGSAAIITAAAASSLIPVVGWVVAAVLLVVAALLAIFNGPKEVMVPISLANMMPGQKAGSLGEAEWQTYGQTTGSLADIARASGQKGAVTDLLTYMNTVALKDMAKFTPTPGAGSIDDLKADIALFFKQELPRIIISEGFGLPAVGTKNTQTEIAGIYNDPKFAPYAFDPNAPIPKMLTALGFTAKAIADIASEIDTKAPDVFLKWLQSLVTVVVGFQNEIAEMSKSGADVVNDITAAQHTSKVQSFQDSADNIVELSKELALYAGDEQLTKAQDLQKLIDQRYQDEVAYIQSIMGMLKQATDNIDALQTKIESAGLTPDQITAKLMQQAFGGGVITDPNAPHRPFTPPGTIDTSVIAQIGRAKTPEDVLAISNAAVAAIGQLYDSLAQLVANATLLRSSMQQLRDMFGDVASQALTHGTGPTGTAAFAAGVDKTFNDLMAASKLSGQAQIDAINAVKTSAASMYQSMLQMIATIKQNVEALHQSIADQIHGIQYANMTPSQQADDIKARMDADRAKLLTATTPEEVKRLTDEIQSLGSTYLGLFAKDDPNRHAAEDWLTKILQDTDKLGTQAYDRLNTDIAKSATAMQTLMTKASHILGDTIDATQVQITALDAQLGLLKAAVLAAMGGFIDATVATNSSLIPALQLAAGYFTGMNDELKNSPGKIRDFNKGLDDAGDALRRFIQNAGGTPSAPSTAPGVDPINAVSTFPRYLANQTGT